MNGHFNKVRFWDFDCDPKELEGRDFCEISPIPLEIGDQVLMSQVNAIVEKFGKTGDCACNNGSVWRDGDRNCWYTGSRKVAEELVKLGAKVRPEKKIRHLVAI